MTKSASFRVYAALILLALGLNARAVVWDGFQTCANNQVLATTTTAQVTNSSAWGRFGLAVTANPVAKTNYGPYGDTVGHFGLQWGAAGADNATLVYCFSAPQNLATNPGVKVKLMTASLPPATNTLVYAEFQDANANIWRTRTALAQALSSAYNWQTFVFDFNAWAMDEVVGTGYFDLSAVTQVRIRFYNPSADDSLQDIYLDDFQSYQPLLPAVVYDSFQSYTNGQVLGTNATLVMADGLARWTRSGTPVSNPVARTNYGPFLGMAGDLSLNWGAGGTSALMGYNFLSVTDLTSLNGVSVKLMTTPLPATTTSLSVEIADATSTIWRTKSQNLSVSNVWQTLSFKFLAAGMTRQNGTGTFASCLGAVTQVRLRFANTAGGTTVQHIYLADFAGPLAASTDTITWDSFQAYANNQVLASTASAQATNAPSWWGEYGIATADKMFGKTGLGPNGETVGDYPMKFSLGGDANLVEYFPALTNLSATPGFSVQLLPSYLTLTTNTWVYALVEQTNSVDLTTTIWKTKAGFPLTTTAAWRPVVFNFTPATMVLASGTDPFDLSSVRSIRIRFENASGDATSQHAYLYNLESYPLKPVAPATAPQPLITQITPGTGSALTLQFTSSDDAPAAGFMLETSPVLGPDASWTQDTAATIHNVSTGVYEAETTTLGGSAQFYRIRR